MLCAGVRISSGLHLSRTIKVLGGKMNQTARKIVAVAVLTIFVLAFAGCPQGTTIGKIQRDPAKFYGKEVAIKGRVSSSFGALGNGVYQVDDGTGKMWVLSEGYGVPGNGADIRVVGRVVDSVTWGGRSFATALRQTERR